MVAPGRAQGTGATGGILLEFPATARAMGLGGAYTAIVGDAGSVFANPAGMATIRRVASGVSWERSPYGTTLSTGAFAARFGRFDVGLGVALLDFGGDSVIVPDPLDPDAGIPDPGGATITAYQALAVGALAYRRGLLSFGASVKTLRERISAGAGSPSTAQGVTGDLAITAALFDLAALAVVVQNAAGRLRSDGDAVPLPRTTRFGFVLTIVDPQGTTRLLSSTEYVAPPGGDAYWVQGVEGGVVINGAGVLGRLGVAMGRAPSDRSSIAYGGTVQLRGIKLDYAFQGYETIGGASHRFGVRWGL